MECVKSGVLSVHSPFQNVYVRSSLGGMSDCDALSERANDSASTTWEISDVELAWEQKHGITPRAMTKQFFEDERDKIIQRLVVRV